MTTIVLRPACGLHKALTDPPGLVQAMVTQYAYRCGVGYLLLALRPASAVSSHGRCQTLTINHNISCSSIAWNLATAVLICRPRLKKHLAGGWYAGLPAVLTATQLLKSTLLLFIVHCFSRFQGFKDSSSCALSSTLLGPPDCLLSCRDLRWRLILCGLHCTA